MVAELLVTGDREFQTAGAVILNALDWTLNVVDSDRVVVDWRISEYELVDDDEASHVDKPADLLSVLFINLHSVCVAVKLPCKQIAIWKRIYLTFSALQVIFL